MSNYIEKEKRLSESILWDLQKNAYQTYGPQAWTQKGVPFYLTSTPMIARHYGSIALGFIRDLLKTNSLDLSEPIYIFDLGAGSGRFSYLFIKHLLANLKQLFSFPIKIRYVMTDIAQRNIDFWQNHPYFQGVIEAGILDFAVYHHDQNEALQLINNKIILEKGSLKNPPIILANYYFDTINQDLFRVENGKLLEGRVTLKLPDDIKKENDSIDPTWIPKLETTFTYHPIDNSTTYYGEGTDHSDFLNSYCSQIQNATFLFPTGPFQTLNYFKQMSPGKFLLVCGDQGVASEIQVKEWERPKMATHSTFSFPVDYHAISKYFQRHGGSGWLTTLPDPVFVVMSAAWGGNNEEYRETEYAFQNSLDAMEPKDYWIMINGIVNKEPPLPLDCLITFLKLGYWDPINAYFFYDSMQKQIPQANDRTKRMLVDVIYKIWEEYFPVSLGEQQFIKNLGLMLEALGKNNEAKFFFDKANNLPNLIKIS